MFHFPAASPVRSSVSCRWSYAKHCITRLAAYGGWLSAVLCAPLSKPAAVSAQSGERPNIVLILADDLGYEGLSCNGGTSFETPSFDRLARQGMRFTNCYAQPICTPSRNKLMTGRSNARNYVGFGVLKRDEITFGSVLQQAGYRTAIAGKWQLTGSGGVFDLDPSGRGTTPKLCGFEQSCMWAYDRDMSADEVKAYYSKLPPDIKEKTSRYWYPAIIQNEKFRPTTFDDYGPDLYCQFLLDFMQQNRDEPFFVYYPMALTHNPFVPTPATAGLTDRDKFKSSNKYFGPMIEYSGLIVERILKKLDQLGLSENTIVLFTADNGTFRSIVSRTADRVIIGGKALPLDAGVHVPMLAWWKGKIAGGSVCHDLIEFSDFFPTIVEAGRARLPTDRPIDGQSFLGRLTGGPYTPRESVFVHYDKDPQTKKPEFRRVRFAFDGRYKLYLDGRLFDIPQDYEEQHPLQTNQLTPEVVQRQAKLQQVLDSMPAWTPDNSYFAGEPDQQTKQRAEQLAKIQEKAVAETADANRKADK